MNVKKFVAYVCEEAAKANIKVVLSDSSYIIADHSIRVAGYFDEENSLLATATGKPTKEWVPILAHEFSHLRQWQAQCQAWINSTTPSGADTTDLLFAWVRGKIELTGKTLDKYTKASRTLELDCERRTVKLIEQFDLPVDIPTYIQSANAYVYFYNYVKLRRRWNKTGKASYTIPQIISEMPKTLYNHYDRLPKKYIKLYDEYC